jgi:hypothetical protein
MQKVVSSNHARPDIKIGTQHWPFYCFNQSCGYFSAVRGIGIWLGKVRMGWKGPIPPLSWVGATSLPGESSPNFTGMTCDENVTKYKNKIQNTKSLLCSRFRLNAPIIEKINAEQL